MSSAWGSSWGVAWGSSWGSASPAPVSTFTQIYHDGYLPQTRTKEEVRRERERLGILPKRAAQVIRSVAKQATEEDLHDARLEQRLKDAIYEAQLAYRKWYVDVLLEELRHEEDEEIVLLLMWPPSGGFFISRSR